jgi:hypothetical protein
MRSPSEQLSEGQPGASELLINPDAEKIVHSHPRRQTCSQSLKLLGHGAAPATDQRCSTELVVEKLSLRFWRMEATRRLRCLEQGLEQGLSEFRLGGCGCTPPVALWPAVVVLGSLETFEFE